ncbi:hypothetical protein DICSQDRAFT_140861 [Dichomitus squalens LYAD-421 SS1]|uniref:Uncharacterized protein n=1 Tax=Dichomitus squalens (strain LYAD-421) TaxID=732165 RepID=R7SL27_DICSQ|nr:uncharacterized protein DICSQDRAFT_140861 [Dichomitus squalens LYAD-421 SS1]EJF56839.1 hypothetical protein DICSQDRAFT_140861 [Dichomitus squalens LYAD-421 SS1]
MTVSSWPVFVMSVAVLLSPFSKRYHRVSTSSIPAHDTDSTRGSQRYLSAPVLQVRAGCTETGTTEHRSPSAAFIMHSHKAHYAS